MLATEIKMQQEENKSIFEQSQCVSVYLKNNYPDGLGSATFNNVRILTLESEAQLNVLPAFPNLFQLNINNCDSL